MSVSRTFGKYIVEASYDDLSPKTIESAQLRLLDYLGTAFHASGARPWGPFLKLFGESGQKQECTVIGEAIKLSCASAAMVNTYPHMSEGSRHAGGHCAWIAMPAALAVAEYRSLTKPATGKDLILAIVLAYEVMLRIGGAIYPAVHEKGFQPTTVRGPMGAAVAAARLLSLDEETSIQALSIAASTGAGLEAAATPWQFYCFQIGRAVESGIIATFAARAGLKGNEDILEEGFLNTFGDHPEPASITTGLGETHLIDNTYIKVHFGCRHAHTAIDACLDLMREHELNWHDIGKANIVTYATALDFCHENGARTVTEAFYDIKALVALGIVHGSLAIRHFGQDVIGSEPVQEIMKRMTVIADPEMEKSFPDNWPAAAEIITRDGRVLTHRREFARGEPEDPLQQAEVEEKFHLLSYAALDENSRNAAIRFVNNLSEHDSLHELFALMAYERAARQ